MSRKNNDFQTVRSEGGLLPPDLLRRIIDPKERLPGTGPEDYGLPSGERLNEIITQSWNRLRRYWYDFRSAVEKLPEGEAATGLTNERWNLPLLRELGFGFLPTTPGPELGGRTYAINRFFGPVPVHLLGCALSLDRRRAGVRGAASTNPHGLVQEFLNRSPNHLWGIVSNGFHFRILRDTQALSRQCFLEFDLETMFSGELYSDFVLFWLTAHATRFAPREGDRADTCWLERWSTLAEELGTRVLGELREGVEKALRILGEGFTGHPRNSALREAIRSGRLTLEEFHGQLLRVIYRLIFLFVAEDRNIDGQPLLHPPDDSPPSETARKTYATHYSTRRIRDMASRIRGSRHGDLWRQFQVVVGALSGAKEFAAAREHLALPILGSYLWDLSATSALNDSELSNYDFLELVRHLAFTRQDDVLRPVDYRNLGAEELGGVYESLLDLTPRLGSDGTRFTFARFAGNARKTSGSYYTPDSLVQTLLDSALEPVIADRIRGKKPSEAEKALLSIKVCDPAVGSGHFLIAAAHRLARHLARIRSLMEGEGEPSSLIYQEALRHVIGRCLYGVDINPMAAELCRVGLWLEAMVPGKPLSFLDRHIRVGNSLFGTTPDLVAAGIPDQALNAIEGDDKKASTLLKKRNKAAQKDGGPIFARLDSAILDKLQQAAAAIESLPDDSPEDVHAKESAFHQHERTDEYSSKKIFYDTWCAAFVIHKTFPPFSDDKRFPSKEPFGITSRDLLDLALGKGLRSNVEEEVEKLSERYDFFHWHLAFPEVLAAGGFDCVLGNPPWERVKIQEKEWFAERSQEIAAAPNASVRKRMIDELKRTDPDLHGKFLEDLRKSEGESHFLRNSGRFPLCGRGDINLYAVFAECMRNLLKDDGRLGCVLPTGIATDDTTKYFFGDLVETKSLVSVFDFENKGFFSGVDSRMKFCLLVCGNGKKPIADSAEYVFFARSVEEIYDPNRRFKLKPEDIALLNPNTKTCPIFRSVKDAELTKAIYRRVPVLIREGVNDSSHNPWGIRFSTMFHMSNDSHLFRTRVQLESDGFRLDGNIFIKEIETEDGIERVEEYLPLFEAKMIHLFDHRWATYDGLNTRDLTVEEKKDSNFFVLPRYWVKKSDVEKALSDLGWNRKWLLGWRDICRSTDERTVIGSIIQRCGVGNNLPICNAIVGPAEQICAIISSKIFDFVARIKVGGTHMNFFIAQQLPLLPPKVFDKHLKWLGDTEEYDLQIKKINNINMSSKGRQNPEGFALKNWLLPRILELTYTAWDMEPFAKDLGFEGPPFKWDEKRRFLIRCELDAAFFHLYLPVDENGNWKLARKEEVSAFDETEEELNELKRHFPTPRDAVTHIMETFPIVKKKDIQRYGTYRTKDTILDIYDAMTEAIRTRIPYRTVLDPPAADPSCCHPPRP